MRSYLTRKSNKPYQYPYFRSIIPKDLVSNLGGATDFRLSLNYVRQEDRQILCLELKHITDEIFTEIREGMKTLSLEDIKDISPLSNVKVSYNEFNIFKVTHYSARLNQQGLRDAIKSLIKKMKKLNLL